MKYKGFTSSQLVLYVSLQEEMIDHLLIYCEIAYALRSELFMIFWIHWVLPDKVASMTFFLDGTIDSKSILQMCGIWCQRV